MDRRAFIGRLVALAGASYLAPSLLRPLSAGGAVVAGNGPYGPLGAADANGIQLPAGFTSRLIGTTNQAVAGTGYTWHSAPDGGACFAVAGGGWVYVSNSEMPGGTGGASAVRFDAAGTIAAAYRILTGTSRNCAGGATPWGTWLSCEEAAGFGRVYECNPQLPSQGVARPLLGTFEHEAAAVDAVTGHVYLTEDDPAGRLYRFTPTTPGDLSAGSLFAANLSGTTVTWVPVSTTSPDRSATTTSFNGGEGAWISDRTLWFTTKGDGRVWELDLDAQQLVVLYDDSTTPGGALERGRQHHRPRALRRPVRGRGRRQPRGVPHHHRRRGGRRGAVPPVRRPQRLRGHRARRSRPTAPASTSARSAAPTAPRASRTRSPGPSAPPPSRRPRPRRCCWPRTRSVGR